MRVLSGRRTESSDDLRAALRIDEESFRRIATARWENPSPACIYRVLDEVQKPGVSIKDWSENLGESEKRSEFDVPPLSARQAVATRRTKLSREKAVGNLDRTDLVLTYQMRQGIIEITSD